MEKNNKQSEDLKKQIIIVRKEIRKHTDKDESLWQYFEEVDDMLANCLNIIDGDYYEIKEN